MITGGAAGIALDPGLLRELTEPGRSVGVTLHSAVRSAQSDVGIGTPASSIERS